jgi:hypothetical protein
VSEKTLLAHFFVIGRKLMLAIVTIWLCLISGQCLELNQNGNSPTGSNNHQVKVLPVSPNLSLTILLPQVIHHDRRSSCQASCKMFDYYANWFTTQNFFPTLVTQEIFQKVFRRD